MTFDLSSPLALHVVGVGGAGMSAIASVFASMGHRVSGSDLKESSGLDRLRLAGVEVAVGHDAANVGEVDAVTISTAVPDSNVEVAEARRRGVPVLRRAESLAAISALRRTLAVAGTHGKTTTTSMLAVLLRNCGVDPSFIIGGEVNEIGSGAHWGDGDWFVVEADESDGTFLELGHEVGLLTSVEPDHVEHWGGDDPLRAAFAEFAAASDTLIVCVDDEGARAVSAGGAGRIETYGTAADAAWRIEDVSLDRTTARFRLTNAERGLDLGVSLAVPGLHNVRNAAGAIVAAVAVGVEPARAAEAMGRYLGVARRFEFRGEIGGITFVDDYAHLPTEIRAALATARDGSWNRVVAVFQPHRYSRTQALWRSFGDAFVGADLLVVTGIYASGEAPRPGVTSKLIVDAVLDHDPRTRLAHLPLLRDVERYLGDRLRSGDLCLTLGAGDLTAVPDAVIDLLRARD